ncbi:MAG: hypothetical protein LC722_07900 [Actinobacteria bacterium]|nr:hypothetical protein [Actinomycetota bacterium]
MTDEVETVDRHLASTYQALQKILTRLDRGPEAGGQRPIDTSALTRGLGAVTAEVSRTADALRLRMEELAGRVSTMEATISRTVSARAEVRPEPGDVGPRLAAIETVLSRAVERLGAIEERAEATLAHAQAGRDGVAQLERTVEGLRALGESRGAAPAADAPAAQPAPAPTADIDALLAAPPGEVPAAEPEPQEALYWDHPDPSPAGAQIGSDTAARPEAAPQAEPSGGEPSEPDEPRSRFWTGPGAAS